jgi:hypothetical protein
MPDPDPMQLTLYQSFELERMCRTVDETNDIATLRKLCKDTLRAWQMQKAATAWAMRQGL